MVTRNRLVAGAIGLALLAAVTDHEPASAVCEIVGPTQFCFGESAELCGPEGDFFYTWTAPDGSTSTEPCVVAAQGGLWRLDTYNYFTREESTCWHSLSVLGGAACTIEGPSSACELTTVTLCGPEGVPGWSWTGPNGFSSSDRCVDVQDGGAYTLTLIGVTDCAGQPVPPCTHELAITNCGGGGGGGGGGTPAESCPRPAVFWGRPCADGGDDDDEDDDGEEQRRSRARITPEQLAEVAACVDERSTLFDWDHDLGSFCATLKPRHVNLRTRAERQFAAVMANVCAGQLGVVPTRGPSVGLDPQALVTLDETRTTVAGWLASAEGTLESLRGAPLGRRAVKDAYRAIIRAGWRINHGQGVEPVCGFRKGVAARFDDATYQEDLEGDESLAEALVDDAEAPLDMAVTGANPFASESRVAFTLGSTEAREVAVGVYDLAGRLVRELARGSFEPGRHEVRWDGRDGAGAPVRNGMYFVVGRIGGDRVDTRLTLVR